MSAGPIVAARGIVKRYPGVLALDHASLEVMPGTVTGLVGKNGAGKSTLIKILAGVVQPDGGELEIDGEPATVGSPREAQDHGFAFVHQELTDVPNLSVAENVELGLGYPKVAGALIRQRALRQSARGVLDRLGLDVDPGTRLAQLSVAQRRLVMIARALAAEARLIVLDEPTAALTDTEIGHLHAVVRTLREEGISMIYVSHRLEEILEVTDRAVVMRDGRDVFERPVADLSMTQLIEEISGGGDALTEGTPAARPAREPGKELLRAESLSHSADGLPGTARPRNINFSLHAGEVLGIAGMVGSGRTELARLIFGADRSSGGRILIDGRPVKLRSPRDGIRAGIALLPEDRRNEGAILGFSVRKNLTLPALKRFRIGGPGSRFPFPSPRRERKEANEVKERLSIKVSDVDAPVRFLSGGNQQKVVLGKWLNRGADIFIFDEPTIGIDVDGKRDAKLVMEQLAEQGKGVIFISSEFSELVGICDRVLVLKEGEIVGQLHGSEISEPALVNRCYATD